LALTAPCSVTVEAADFAVFGSHHRLTICLAISLCVLAPSAHAADMRDLAEATKPLLEWLDQNATSAPFIAGVACGLVAAGALRVLGRILGALFGSVVSLAGFARSYGLLIAVGIAAYSYGLFVLFN
jgi:hypothetical protein